MNRLFHNDNGFDYCILEGTIGEPALLANMRKDEFVVAIRLNESNWHGGIYIRNLGKAYKEYRSICPKKKKDFNH